MEMENHLEKDDGCYDNAEAAFSDDEEELNSKGQGAPGIPQGCRIPATLENSRLSVPSGADPVGRSQVSSCREAVEELIPKSKGFLPFPGRSQELRALFQPQIPTDLTRIPLWSHSWPRWSHPCGIPAVPGGFPSSGKRPQAQDGAEDVSWDPQNPNPKSCHLGNVGGSGLGTGPSRDHNPRHSQHLGIPFPPLSRSPGHG